MLLTASGTEVWRHRHREPREGLNNYDTTNKKWGLSMATSGDRYLATGGDFLLAAGTGDFRYNSMMR
jgi:hypothetical protein